nr:MAG TPA: hypothetical protein [Caudoviricetes sp.]
MVSIFTDVLFAICANRTLKVISLPESLISLVA